MAIKVGVVVMCLLAIPIVTSLRHQREMGPEEEKRFYSPKVHPCYGTVHNRTIKNSKGVIVCLVPTEKELIDQLNKIGGYNHHYVAITLAEAEANFDQLLENKPQPKPTPKCRGHRGGRHGGHHMSIHKREVLCKEPLCYKKGSVRARTKTVRICSECQKCTELPESIFPRYLNEVICNATASSGSECYRGIGNCKQKTMNIDVLTKQAEDYEFVHQNETTTIYKQVWSSKVQPVKTCCECEVVDDK